LKVKYKILDFRFGKRFGKRFQILCWFFVLDFVLEKDLEKDLRFCVGFLCWIFVLEKDLENVLKNVLVPPITVLLYTDVSNLQSCLKFAPVVHENCTQF